MRVSLGLVNFASPIVQRLQRDVLPTLAHYPDGVFEIICIDNDPKPHTELQAFLASLTIPVKYLWNGGSNVQISAAKNQLYALAAHPILVYVCANHGRMYDPTWLADLVQPLENPQVAMTGAGGYYQLADIGAGAGRAIFIQGGLLAARVEILRKHPLSEHYPHAHSDKWISRELMNQGYLIRNVPTVMSLWQQRIPEAHSFKYFHAEE